MKTVFADGRLTSDIEAALNRLGYDVLRLPPFPALAPQTASHPDMLLFAVPQILSQDGKIISGGEIFCHEKFLGIASEQFLRAESLGYEIIPTMQPISEKYPGDILFNCALVGKKLIANAKFTSKKVLAWASQAGVEVVNVKQGYAKCSVCIVSENAIITADNGIAAAAHAAGISVLHLPGAGAILCGYDRGFIGGASGNDGETLFFTGSLSSLGKDYASQVQAFCEKYSKKAVSLSDAPLYDFGSLIFI